MLALFLIPLVAGQLTNDVCWGATNVTTGVNIVGNTYAASPWAQTAAFPSSYLDVFYVYTPTCSGTVDITAASATYLYLAVFLGRSCAGLATTTSTSGYSISRTADVYGPTDRLYFSVGSYTPSVFALNISCTSASVAAGDMCSTALPIVTGVPLPVSTTNAVSSQAYSGCSGPEIFLVYNATCDGDANVDVSGGSNNIKSFYPGTCDKIVPLDWGRASCAGDSQSFPVRTGQQYYFAVGYYSGQDYIVTVTCTSVPRPANDQCTGALTISGTSLIFDTTNATDSVPGAICDFASQDVWYTYNATCTGDLVVQVNDSSVQAMAFKDCWYTTAATDCANSLTFPVIQNHLYKLVLGHDADAVVEVNFSCVPRARPSNDWCANGINVTAPSTQVVDLSLASTDSFTVCSTYLRKDLYFRYTTCAGNNVVTVDGGTSTSSLEISGFIDCNIEPLVCQDFGSGSELAFATPIALPVYIGVGVYYEYSSSGNVTVNFSCSTSEPTAAPTSQPTTPTPPTTNAPTPLPTTQAPATQAPTTHAPSPAGNTNNTNNTNTTGNSTAAPTLSGAAAIQFSLGVVFLGLVTQM